MGWPPLASHAVARRRAQALALPDSRSFDSVRFSSKATGPGGSLESRVGSIPTRMRMPSDDVLSVYQLAVAQKP